MISAFVIAVALACPAHMLWRMLRGKPACGGSSRAPVNGRAEHE